MGGSAVRSDPVAKGAVQRSVESTTQSGNASPEHAAHLGEGGFSPIDRIHHGAGHGPVACQCLQQVGLELGVWGYDNQTGDAMSGQERSARKVAGEDEPAIVEISVL